MQEGATLSRTGRRRRARGRRVRADARRSTPRSASILRRRRRRAPRRRWPPGSRAVRRDDAGQAFGETFDPRQGAIGEHFLTLYSSGGTVSARFAQRSLRSLLSRRRRHWAALRSSSPRFSGTKGLLFSVFGTMVPYLKPHVKPLDLRSNAKTLATAAPAKRGRALSVGSRLRRVWAAPASGERPRRPRGAGPSDRSKSCSTRKNPAGGNGGQPRRLAECERLAAFRRRFAQQCACLADAPARSAVFRAFRTTPARRAERRRDRRSRPFGKTG